MTAMQNILVPTDFGEMSRRALKHALVLADALGASLHVMHVIDPTLAVAPGMPGAGTDAAVIWNALEQSSEEQLERVLTPEQEEQYDARLIRVAGSPSLEIVQYAQNNGIDLIVMGTHGRGPLAEMVLGGVARRVVRSAPCPVLLCAPSSKQALDRSEADLTAHQHSIAEPALAGW